MHQTMYIHQGNAGVTLHADYIACRHLSCQNTSQQETDRARFSAAGMTLQGAVPLLERMQECAALPRQASPAAICLALILSSTSWALISAGKLSTILILLLGGIGRFHVAFVTSGSLPAVRYTLNTIPEGTTMFRHTSSPTSA